jgi:hypothetical protein
MLKVNTPEALAGLTSAFEAYESALQRNDLAELERLFWASPLTLRYGVQDVQHSHAEIARFRRDRGPIDQRRTLRNTRITTFGGDFGVVNTEYVPYNDERIGRQSQTWIRTDEGWRISSAHVSLSA